MFTKSSIETKLEEEIVRQLDTLDSEGDPEKYATALERVTKLHKIKSEEGLKPPSLDTLLVVGANVFGILWLTRYERANVISSKALGFVMKPR